jgi:hypothetical protein
MDEEQLSVARQAFGEDLIRYALGLDSALLDSVELSPQQVTCLQTLSIFGSFTLAAEPGINQDTTRAEILAPFEAEVGLITQFRTDCGGSVTDISTDDEVAALLLACVRDTFPTLMMPASINEIGHFHPNLGSSMYRLEAAKKLPLAILNDPDLSRLFPTTRRENLPDEPTRGQLTEISSWITWLGGTAGDVQLVGVPTALVTYALTMAGIHGDLTYEACVRYALEGLRAARALARGKPASLPLLAGLANVSLDDDVDSIDTRNARLHKPTPIALARLGAARDRTIGIVLLLDVNQRALDIRGPRSSTEKPEDTWTEDFQRAATKAHETSDYEIDKLRYAMLLASEDHRYIAPTIEIVTQLDPVTLSSSGILSGIRFPVPPSPITITRDIALRIQHWATKVSDHHPKSLDIGLRRLLSATTRRIDPKDTFVDAVLCWENLFGDQGESTFKVCGSLAMLLQPDNPEERAKLYKDLKDLYTLRSQIVHGSSEPDLATAFKKSEQAVRVAFDAMQAAYDEPGLLECKDSKPRYKKMLLRI